MNWDALISEMIPSTPGRSFTTRKEVDNLFMTLPSELQALISLQGGDSGAPQAR